MINNISEKAATELELGIKLKQWGDIGSLMEQLKGVLYLFTIQPIRRNTICLSFQIEQSPLCCFRFTNALFDSSYLAGMVYMTLK
jgi:hypothetical protein